MLRSAALLTCAVLLAIPRRGPAEARGHRHRQPPLFSRFRRRRQASAPSPFGGGPHHRHRRRTRSPSSSRAATREDARKLKVQLEPPQGQSPKCAFAGTRTGRPRGCRSASSRTPTCAARVPFGAKFIQKRHNDYNIKLHADGLDVGVQRTRTIARASRRCRLQRRARWGTFRRDEGEGSTSARSGRNQKQPIHSRRAHAGAGLGDLG